MRNGTTRAMALLLATVAVQAAHGDEELLYRLGGGEAINIGATNRTTPIRLGVGAQWDADLVCGEFDLGTSVRNQLNGVTGAVRDVMGNVMETATGVVASLPALAIQRLNPGLYDLLQNGVLEASQEFRVARLRCRDLTHDMGRTLVHEGWRGIAETDYWREQIAVGGRDALDVAEEAERDGPDNGVPWTGGRPKGGAGQEPIRVNADIAVAGMNLLIGRAPTDMARVGAAECGEARICEVWADPRGVADFVARAVGDVEVRTCRNCEKVTSTPGIGLASIYSRYKAENENILAPLVTGSGVPGATVLEGLSEKSGMRVSRGLVEAMREEPRPQDVAARLAGELAVGQVLVEASLARRALAAGMKEPNVANNEAALRQARRALDDLDAEIGHLETELRVRSIIASNTSVEILRRQSLRRRSVTVAESEPAAAIAEGALERR